MATSFRLHHGDNVLTVPRKFLSPGKELKVGYPKPTNDESGIPTPRYWPHRLPQSAFELEIFEHLKKDFEIASQQCDTELLPVSIPSYAEIKNVKDFRAYAKSVGTAGGQAQKYDELSEKHSGLKHSQYISMLREQVSAKFINIFDGVRPVHPDEQGYHAFIYGAEVEAEEHIKEAMYTLAKQGHVYAQFIGSLLATPFDEPLSAKSVELLLQAHSNGFPMALAALGERLLAENYFVDCLQCVIMALEGGYVDASSILDDLQKRTHATLLETDQGLKPFLPYLVNVELSEDMRNLLYKHKPEWVPLTPKQQAEAFFARRMGKGVSYD